MDELKHAAGNADLKEWETWTHTILSTMQDTLTTGTVTITFSAEKGVIRYASFTFHKRGEDGNE